MGNEFAKMAVSRLKNDSDGHGRQTGDPGNPRSVLVIAICELELLKFDQSLDSNSGLSYFIHSTPLIQLVYSLVQIKLYFLPYCGR